MFTVCPEGGLFIRISRLLHGFREEGLRKAPRKDGCGGVRRDAVGAFRSDAVLSETGTYLFSFVPLMPDPLVKGVAAVGVDIYRSED